MVSAMGGGVEPLAAAGVTTAGLSAGGSGLLAVLQVVASAGHGGVGPAVHGPGGGTKTVGDIAIGGMEGGAELVF